MSTNKGSNKMSTSTKTKKEIKEVPANVINYLTVSDVSKFNYNPYNPRLKNHQLIQLTPVSEKNDDGVVTTSYNYALLSDEKLSELGTKVTENYRRAFNELINSLVTFNDDDEETITIDVMNPLRVTPLDAVEKGFYTVLSGNTRLHIINQVLEQRGSDKVILNVPYTIVEYEGLADLLSNGLRDNTGIPLDSTAQWDVLTNAFEASKSISDDLETRLNWIRDTVTYASNSQPNGNKRIPSSILSKWSITIKAPNFCQTFDKFINRSFLSRFHNLLSNFVDLSDQMVIISLTTELGEYLAKVGKTQISSEKAYTSLAEHLKKKYNPEPEKEDKESEKEDSDDSDESAKGSILDEAKMGAMIHQIKVSVDKLPGIKDVLDTVKSLNVEDFSDVKNLNTFLKTLVTTVDKIKNLIEENNKQ